MKLRLIPVAALVVGALAIAASPAAAGGAHSRPSAAAGESPVHLRFDADEPPDCTQLYPQRFGVSGVTDSGKTVALDVQVLIDTKDTLAVAEALRDAQTVDERAAAQERFDGLVAAISPQLMPGKVSYEALDVEYKLSFDLFAPFNDDGTPRSRTTAASRDSQTIIDLAKSSLGGTRPAGIDVVYVITDQDISAPGFGNAVAGQADCIGGVAWPDTAFGVGEIFPAIRIGPISFYREGTAKVMAHEIGHLLGAHHHYQSCGPHAAAEALAGGFGACSLMTNFVDFTTFEFSPLSGGVVRAHAVDFADMVPDE